MRFTIAPDGTVRGEAPRISPRALPSGMGQVALNAKLKSGDLEAYNDILPIIALSKPGPIASIYLMSNGDWLSWSTTELNAGAVMVDVTPGPIPGDTSGRLFLTGVGGKPQWTNTYYATDPSQRGTKALGEFPYVTQDLGVPAPTAAPTATTAGLSDSTAIFEYAQEASVNNALLLDPGSAYQVGDILSILGGVAPTGFDDYPAQISVTEVDSDGRITQFLMQQSGFYLQGDGPASPAAVSGGSGSDATFSVTVVGQQGSANTPPPGWAFSSYDNSAGSYGQFAIDNAYGLGHLTWDISSGQGDTVVVYSTQAFLLRTATDFTFQADGYATGGDGGTPTAPDLLLQFAGLYNGKDVESNVVGPTLVASIADGTLSLYNQIAGTNGGAVSGSAVASTPYAFARGVQYRFIISAVQQSQSSNPGFSITVKVIDLTNPTIIVATLTGFVLYAGEQFAVGHNHRYNHDYGNASLWENILITVDQPAAQATLIDTDYVITNINQYQLDATDTFTQESGPSDPSNAISVKVDTTRDPNIFGPVQLAIPPSPAGTAFNGIYRAATDVNGNVAFYFVAQIPASTSAQTYTDTKLDENLGDELVTTYWEVPPADMHSILSLPNGMMAGASKNQMLLSDPSYPNGWLLEYEYATEKSIVTIGAIDNNVELLTQSHPYSAFGSSPDAFTMSKEEFSIGCTSKPSLAYLRGIGIVYSSAEGVMAYSGQGRIANLTQSLFTREQWAALNPASIYGIVHESRYYFFWNNGTAKGGYILDADENGVGLVELDFHATCGYVDPISDQLYFCLDTGTTEPTNEIMQWDAANTLRPYTYRSKKFIGVGPASMEMARVRALDYVNLTFQYYVDGTLILTRTVTSMMEFLLPDVRGEVFEVQLSGTSRVIECELAETAEELE